jgi:aminomethyltransferase
MEDKRIVLHDTHEALGAKMVPFAGYIMPVSYTSITQEHLSVREKAGLFDVSHMGEFIVRGKEACDLVQHISSNDAAKLEIGDVQYSCIPNRHGGIIDDFLVYRLDEDRCADGERAYMLVVNASNIEKDLNWIVSNNTFDATVENISDSCGLLALQGPAAIGILQGLTDIKLDEIEYYHFTKGTLAGLDNVLISATGYTGSGGFELYVRNSQMQALWDALMKVGKTHGLEPAGLGARDTLRLEMGFCLYGNDINDDTNPFEAGLSWITKVDKGEFLAKDVLTKIKSEPRTRQLVGFTVEGRRVPRHGYAIEDEAGQVIGKVTSGTSSPSLGIAIGMGYVHSNFKKAGQKIMINMGKKSAPAEVVKLPFLKN